MTDLPRMLAAFTRDRLALELKTVDLCFLAALYFKADKAALASFDEDQLLDVFEVVCETVEADADNVAKRATHAIQRLREQRMLARVDGGGVVRAGEYALSRLAAGIVEFFLADEALTRESLTLLTGTLRAQLADVLAAAKKASDVTTWRGAVVGPLRVTVAELVSGIERRQRGLDRQQEDVQEEITNLLSADWFDAVERCEALLASMTSTLRELNEVLLRDTHHFVALLQDIQTLAASAGNGEAEDTVQRVIEHVDRIASWGVARQRAWTEFFQYTHGYLQQIVRLDPDRALSQRLRDQVTSWAERPFRLRVCAAQPIMVLRPPEARADRQVTRQPRRERDVVPDWVGREQAIDLEALVRRALERGATTLAEVSSAVLAVIAPERRFVSAGRVADIVGRSLAVVAPPERDWRAIDERLEIEDWRMKERVL